MVAANALKRRGSLTIWFDATMTWDAAPTGKRGRQPDYSGEEDQKTVRGTVFPTNAIQTCLTMKVLFGMALRQIEPWERLPIAAPPVQARWATVRVPMARRICRESVTAHRPGLARAELQHAEPPPEDPEGEHPLSRVPGPAPPPDRHRAGKRHRFERTGEGDQGRGRRRVE